jgi:hypothetical protein
MSGWPVNPSNQPERFLLASYLRPPLPGAPWSMRIEAGLILANQRTYFNAI